MENYVKIKFLFYDNIDDVEKIESMWATPVGQNYRIENSSFYALEYALGDIVNTKKVEGELFVNELVEASGNSTIQIVFYDKEIITPTREKFKKMGCSSELSNIPSLIAVNVPSTVNYYEEIKPYLENGANSDLWSYQEACLAQ